MITKTQIQSFPPSDVRSGRVRHPARALSDLKGLKVLGGCLPDHLLANQRNQVVPQVVEAVEPMNFTERLLERTAKT